METKMRDAGATSNETDEKIRSTEETAAFLNEKFGPDECDRLALIACMIDIAVYEKQPNDALFWSMVLARRERCPLGAEIRRELQALLDDPRNGEGSRSWASQI